MILRPGSLHSVVPAKAIGSAKVVHDSPDALTRLRAARDGQPLRADKYTRLFVDGELWMTDADFECATNSRFVDFAEGDVLVGGLGLGLIIRPILAKAEVNTVTVIERSADVISLIEPTLPSPKLNIIHADVRSWELPKKRCFNVIYLDTWRDVPNSDQRDDIKGLRARYRKTLRGGGWIAAWCESSYARRAA